ncbi:7508_t:CDS:2, partial [Paraglomus occultum]
DLRSYVSVLFRDVNYLSKGFWNRDPSRWGGLCDWDMFFIQQIPEATKWNAHHSLAAELRVLMRLPHSSPCHQHAVLMMTSLKDCHKNDSNVNLWSKYMKELAGLTVANRVDTFSVESAAFTTGATALRDHFERKTANLLRNNLTGDPAMSSQETVSEGMPDEIIETPVMKQAQLVGLVEMTGGPNVRDLPRYIKDHVRGYWGMRDLLNGIAADMKYCQGSFAVIRRLRVYFIQTHGLDIEIWAMDCPVSELFRMYFIGCAKLPLYWDYKNGLITLLPLLWDLKNGLEKTGNSLGILKLTSGQVLAKSRSQKRYQENNALSMYFHTQQQTSPMLADTKRDTKEARTLKPYEDYPEE